MKRNITPAIIIAVLLLLAFSCQKQPAIKALTPKLPDTPYSYVSPCWGSSMPCNESPNNVVTPSGATLGRVLFYDPRLSLNNTVSCASCHLQQNAFADNGKSSVGFEGKVTNRNSPGFVNNAFKGRFFWDGRANSLEEMVLMPVQHHVEMGMEKLDDMEKKIASVSYYPELFKKAFQTEEVSSQRISYALAQFLRSMQSVRSKMDMGQLNALEKDGQKVFFKSNCGVCHMGNNFGGDIIGGGYSGNTTVLNVANIGLDIVYADKGLGDLTGNPQLDGSFVIPSLRNLSFTAPYMHDGRYQTLEEVVEHYNSGIQPSAALDHNLIDSTGTKPLKMNMTAYEKEALVAFLHALSDPAITTDVRFSNPFK